MFFIVGMFLAKGTQNLFSTCSMKRFALSTWTIIKKTISNFISDDSFDYASSIAFYTIFSLPAILIIALSIGSAFYEQDIVQGELVNQVSRLIGTEGAKEVENILLNASVDTNSFVARVAGVITLLFSATTVFLSLQTSLNKIWGIKPKPARGWLKYIINRLLSLAMVISFGFLLLVSLVIDAVLAFFNDKLETVMEGFMLNIVTVANVVISLMFITVIFGLLFKVLPDARIRWRDVWVGSMVTTGLFTLGKYLIGFYLGNSTFNSAYGAAGSLVIILVWVYYSTVIFLFGAELTSVYATERGAEIRPYNNAVKVQMVEMERT
jgi:membrane protein